MQGAGGEQGDGGSLSTKNLEAMIRGFARFGVGSEALTRALEQRLAARASRTVADVFLAWNDVYVHELPPLSALFVGAASPFGSWEVVDFLTACYPTVGEALRRLPPFFKLINAHVEFLVGPGARGELPFVEFRHQLSARDEFFDEYTAGIFLGHFRQLTGHPIALAAAHVVRSRLTDPAWRAEVERFLGCAPTYEARWTRLVFTREAWEAPLVGANPRLRAALEMHAERLVREVQDARSLAERVRARVAQGLRDGEPRISVVARQLGMTPRTLQRRLQDEGVGFSALVDEARLWQARRLLDEADLAIAEVSYALGYSEPSAFTRAFKRWVGCGPVEYREARRKTPG